MVRIDAYGLALNLLDYGGDGSPLLLIHGGLDLARAWCGLAERLAAGWHVHAVDLRGHGNSDWSRGGDYDLRSHLSDLSIVLDAIGSNVTVIGHSMGARLALMLAAARSDAVAQVVAIEGLNGGRMFTPSATPVTDRMAEWIEDRRKLRAAPEPQKVQRWLADRKAALAVQRRYPDLASVVARLLDDSDKRLSAAQAGIIAEWGTRAHEDGELEWRFDPLLRVMPVDSFDDATAPDWWREIACPILHLFGADSWAWPPRDADLACFADARVVALPGAGHWVHLNRPAETRDTIIDFLTAGAATSSKRSEAHADHL